MPALNNTGNLLEDGTAPLARVCTSTKSDISDMYPNIVCDDKCADGYSIINNLCYKNVCPTGTTFNTTFNVCVSSK